MSPLIVVLFLISNIIFTFAVERFMSVFYGKRRTPLPVFILTYLLYFILASAERLMYNTFAAHMIFTIPALFIVTLNYESPLPKRFVAAMSNYVLFSVVTSIMAYNLYLLPADISVIVNDNLIGQYLSASLISYVGVLLFRRFTKIRESNFSMPLFWGYALVIPITIEAIMFFGTLNLTWLVDTLAVVLFIGAFLLVFYVYDSFSAAYEEKLKSALYSQEKEYYLAQSRLMLESVEKMKSFRHDVKNHLVTLKNYSAGNKVATDYLDSLLGDIGESEVYSDTGNIVFDSIINYKLKNAKEDNIKLDLHLFVPRALNVEVVDIVTILGNLLDNALDAVAKVEDRIIKLNVEFNKSNLFIKIENTYDGTIRYAEGGAGEEKRLVTSKDGDGHGHGLKNILRTVEKYDGHIEITHDEKYFSVGILLYVND